MDRLPWDCIYLAAGMSVRMGTSKQILPLQGKPLFLHGLETALKVCRRVILVTGASDLTPYLKSQWKNLVLVENTDYAKGQLGSLKKGIQAAETECVFVMLADLPDVKPETYGALSAAMIDQPAVFPLCHGRRGHPVLMGPKALALILLAAPDRKAMTVIQPLCPLGVQVRDPGIFRDVDTPEDLVDR